MLVAEIVSTRVSQKELEQVEKLVKMGYYLNTADFIRSSVREKLEKMQILVVRDVDIRTAKKEILNLLKKTQLAYPSDIATHLGLDLTVTMEAINQLIKEGKIKE